MKHFIILLLFLKKFSFYLFSNNSPKLKKLVLKQSDAALDSKLTLLLFICQEY